MLFAGATFEVPSRLKQKRYARRHAIFFREKPSGRRNELVNYGDVVKIRRWIGYGQPSLPAREYHEDLRGRGPVYVSNMKASRKGTRLNDAFYFRQPLPHPRKMMTAMCLMPQVSNMQLSCHFAPERLLQDANISSRGNSRDHNRKLDIRQSSIEMARISWPSDQEKMDSVRYHSTYAETDKELMKEPEEEKVAMAEVELIPEVEEVVEVIERVESLEQNDTNTDILVENYEKKSQRKRFSWWRDINVGQLIYQLFSHFFTRKHASPGKHRTKKVATKYRMQTVANSEKVVKVDRNERKQRSHHPRSDDLPRPIEEEYEDKAVSMFVRQIERTRDKNLRVTLLEKELRTRTYVEETRKCGLHSEIDERGAARQISSPLC